MAFAQSYPNRRLKDVSKTVIYLLNLMSLISKMSIENTLPLKPVKISSSYQTTNDLSRGFVLKKLQLLKYTNCVYHNNEFQSQVCGALRSQMCQCNHKIKMKTYLDAVKLKRLFGSTFPAAASKNKHLQSTSRSTYYRYC